MSIFISIFFDFSISPCCLLPYAIAVVVVVVIIIVIVVFVVCFLIVINRV